MHLFSKTIVLNFPAFGFWGLHFFLLVRLFINYAQKRVLVLMFFLVEKIGLNFESIHQPSESDCCSEINMSLLVGGFNPLETYESKWVHLPPIFGVKINKKETTNQMKSSKVRLPLWWDLLLVVVCHGLVLRFSLQNMSRPVTQQGQHARGG